MGTADELEEYLLEKVRVEVLAGYLDEKEVPAFIKDLVEGEPQASPGLVEPLLALARRMLDERLVEEVQWTRPTLNDRIDHAFDELNRNGIIALQNAGYTMSDGWGDAITVARCMYEKARGATFFHGQDVERALLDQGLMLAFGALGENCAPVDDDEASLAIAREVRETLARHGVPTEWNGSADTRIQIPPFPWRKRRWTTTTGERTSRSGTADEPPTRFSIERAVQGVMREKGISREDAVAALQDFFCARVQKHYGEQFHFEAGYEPEADKVEVFRVIRVVERHTDAASAANERTLDQLGPIAEHAAPGDEFVLSVFYREEDWAEARAQDEQYGQVLDMVTAGRPLKSMSVRAVRDGILQHLRLRKP